MNQQEQLRIVEKARALLIELSQKRAAVNKIQNQIDEKKSEQPPAPPTCVQLPPPSPPTITPTVKFNKLLAFLPSGILLILSFLNALILVFFMLSLLWIPFYFFAIYQKQKKDNIVAIGQSPAYQQQYNLLLQEHQRQQEEENQKYRAAKEIYDNQTLPQFEAARNKAIAEYERQLQPAIEERDTAEKALVDFWNDEGSIVPEQFRDRHIFKGINHLIKIMQSDGLEIEPAIVKYEQEQEEERKAMIRQMEIDRQQREEEERLARERAAYEAEQRAYEASQRSSGGSFIRDAAVVATGTYIGDKLTDHRREREARKRSQDKYTCALGCPNKTKYGGKCSLGLRPETCGRGLQYWWGD